jgi:uncharacterized membrane protein (DUF4010 family)
MPELSLLEVFTRFGLTVLIGFMIGLERETSENKNPHTGLRDFVLFALLGATSTYTAALLDSVVLVIIGFIGFIVLLLSGFWAEHHRNRGQEPGVTTETAAIMTYFLGVLVMYGIQVVAIALSIVVLVILSQAKAIGKFRSSVQRFELDAGLKLLIITFIVLPVLPQTPLDEYATVSMGQVIETDAANQSLLINLVPEAGYEDGDTVKIYIPDGPSLGAVTLNEFDGSLVRGTYEGTNFSRLGTGNMIDAEFGIPFVTVMLSAINPYKVWIIVILVSFISFIGYVLVKIFGSRAGIGLTGLVGGLASSTVTTLSFARRSRETPALNTLFAIAVILASTVMFPRLLMQIAVVNRALMERMAVPIAVMAVTGVLVATWYFLRTKAQSQETQTLSLHNPFSLKSAITFSLVFATILMVTRLAITYLGNAWLPLVAVVSGLTDADAIAFSVSDTEQAGLISLDWAAFNVVLGAVANTFMKLLLVLSLGDRGLFKQLLGAVIIIGTAGLASAFFYYDFS